jgi:hypothetical protein
VPNAELEGSHILKRGCLVFLINLECIFKTVGSLGRQLWGDFPGSPPSDWLQMERPA